MAEKSRVRSAVKDAREAIASKDAGKVKTAVVSAARSLAKAGSKGVLHKRTVARRTSRLARAAFKATQA
jgi:small subunit ribosomal protein S20